MCFQNRGAILVDAIHVDVCGGRSRGRVRPCRRRCHRMDDDQNEDLVVVKVGQVNVLFPDFNLVQVYFRQLWENRTQLQLKPEF